MLNRFILIFVIFFVSGCSFKSVYEQRQEIRAKEYQLVLDQYVRNGIKKDNAIEWIKNGFRYDKADYKLEYEYNKYFQPIKHNIAKPWIEAKIISPSNAQYFATNDIDPDEAVLWINSQISSKNIVRWVSFAKIHFNEASKWIQLGFENPEDIDGYEYESFVKNLKKSKLTADQFKQWVAFGVRDFKVIKFLRSKKVSLKSIKEKTLEAYINKMPFDKFLDFMNVKNKREVNGYLYHWKYDTNYKRFYKILDEYYKINVKEKLRSFDKALLQSDR